MSEGFPKISEDFPKIQKNHKKHNKNTFELFPKLFKKFHQSFKLLKNEVEAFPKFSEIRADFRALLKISVGFPKIQAWDKVVILLFFIAFLTFNKARNSPSYHW